MKIILNILLLLNLFESSAQNCMSLFSYGANFETVQFFNQSMTANAHYYWNFGDGTSSNLENPIHIYPENGEFFVTLYAYDTLSTCSDFYELWINIAKNAVELCDPSIENTFFLSGGDEYMIITDNSINCNSYYVNYDFGPSANLTESYTYSVQGYPPSRFISRAQYYENTFPNNLIREAYKSTPYNYSSGKNYGECSANFEFRITEESAQGQTFIFEAMNKNAESYEWGIIGFGAPIVGYSDTISKSYGFGGNYNMGIIRLYIEEANGCRDTMYQQIHIRQGVQTTVGISELTTVEKKIIKVYDLLGREAEVISNTILIYLYDDGSTEKVLKLD